MSRDMIFLLQAVAAGVMITFVYDWLRILRRVISHRPFVVALEDFFFWVICGIAVFLWMYRVSNGGMRWFAIAGALMGMLLYKKIFSEFLVTYAAKLLGLILKLLGKIVSVLIRPLRAVGRKAGFLQKRMGNCRKKISGNIKIWLKSGLKALKIRLWKK